jgi:AraC-like DNA-binding protein/quercetin dioxygenase-like cupin family protein
MQEWLDCRIYAIIYRMHAKHQTLLDTDRANGADGPSVIAVYSQMEDRQSQDMHSHSRGQALAAQRGLLRIDTERGRMVVPPGHAVWLPPHCAHGLASHGQFTGWSIYAAEDACTPLPSQVRVVRISGLLREAVLRAASWTQEQQLSTAQQRVCDLILDELAAAPPEQLDLPLPTDKRLRKIAQAIETDPADARSLEEWAQWAAIAPRTLTRNFAAETGMPFSAWRQRARLIRALEMLAAGSAVTTIAIELGYDSLSAFIAMFKRSFGVTPAKYLEPH